MLKYLDFHGRLCSDLSDLKFDWDIIKFNSDGAFEWATNIGGTANESFYGGIGTDQNGNVYVAGRSMGSGGSAENMVTIKYDPSGTQIWRDT